MFAVTLFQQNAGVIATGQKFTVKGVLFSPSASETLECDIIRSAATEHTVHRVWSTVSLGLMCPIQANWQNRLQSAVATTQKCNKYWARISV